MTIDELKTYGANTEEGLRRCMNNESFYLRMVRSIPGDPDFQKLYEALDKGELEEAFEAAHHLKGSAANLSLTPLYAPLSQITESLRNKAPLNSDLIRKVRDSRDALARICES